MCNFDGFQHTRACLVQFLDHICNLRHFEHGRPIAVHLEGLPCPSGEMVAFPPCRLSQCFLKWDVSGYRTRLRLVPNCCHKAVNHELHLAASWIKLRLLHRCDHPPETGWFVGCVWFVWFVWDIWNSLGAMGLAAQVSLWEQRQCISWSWTIHHHNSCTNTCGGTGPIRSCHCITMYIITSYCNVFHLCTKVHSAACTVQPNFG